MATFDQAIDEALRQEMTQDPHVIWIGQRVPPKLLAEFGDSRVLRAPIAEPAMMGIAVGAAASGYRPIVNFSNVTFSLLAFDQIANQAARMRYMFGAQRSLPLVMRAQYFNGTNAAAQHSLSGYAFYAHLGGIKVAVPSSPGEACGLLKTAIHDEDPVFVFEAGRVAGMSEDALGEVAPIPLGKAAVRRPGDSVTVVAIGYMVHCALAAAEDLAAEGISVEVIDPRTLVPFDSETVRVSVARTGRLVVVDESFPTCSAGSEIIASVLRDDRVFSRLASAPKLVATAPVPVPFSAPLEDWVLPNAADIRDAVRAVC